MVQYKNSFGETAYKDATCTEIINTSKPFEDNIRAVWSRNVFFILWYALIYTYFFIFAICNRLKRGIKWLFYKIRKKQYVYCRKVSNNRLIEMHNLIVESNIWQTMWFMLLFYSIGISKLVYHIAIICAWITRKILVPIIIWASIMFSVICFCNAIAAGKQKSHHP